MGKNSHEVSSREVLSKPNSDNSDAEQNELRMSVHRRADTRRRAYPPVVFVSTQKTAETRPLLYNNRRHWLVSASAQVETTAVAYHRDDKDEGLKNKINMLVAQTMHDTDVKVKSVQKLKEKHRDRAPYRVGFILSMIKKSRDVLNELFNVAVKHREEWKALEQLKIFELIVHTNVDTTNLVRQLVEIHINYLNTTNMQSSRHSGQPSDQPQEQPKNRVVLL
ncbi:uncharacterized protein LOC126372655 [Pectinophora gossypiella]|uniref:uncharacterized protein LOC126372655 n=1 Tax=Pectinophora gossypiella TaxID=13191 RepID=UPI00214E5F2F|nr:uncharacterized protein LOC126372655 [Pectinophora gossypiella]